MNAKGIRFILAGLAAALALSPAVAQAQSPVAMVVMYEVCFTPAGTTGGQHFFTSSELRRVGPDWRIVPPTGEAAMPEWKPYPRPVDS